MAEQQCFESGAAAVSLNEAAVPQAAATPTAACGSMLSSCAGWWWVLMTCTPQGDLHGGQAAALVERMEVGIVDCSRLVWHVCLRLACMRMNMPAWQRTCTTLACSGGVTAANRRVSEWWGRHQHGDSWRAGNPCALPMAAEPAEPEKGSTCHIGAAG